MGIPEEMRGSDSGQLTLGILDNDPYAVDYLEILFKRSSAPIHVLWTTTVPRNALKLCEAEAALPQVILTDMSMPEMSGIEFAREITALYPAIKVVGITALRSPDEQDSARQAGISAVLNKDETVMNIVRTLGHVVGNDAAMYWQGPGSIIALNDTECDIFSMFAQGRTLQSIAVRLGISPATVKVHMKRAYAKLNAHSRTEAIAICIRDGLI